MKQYHKYVGLDVHKERNEVALAESSGEVRLYGSIPNDLHALEKLVYKLRADGVVLHFVYEAGPCGFVIYRRLRQLGEDCVVVAPSLIPKKSGDHVKTDRRDAVMLARLHRAGELTGIHVLEERDEHPFGTIKRGMEAGYFLLRGLEKVRAEMSLTVLASNLKRAINLLGVPTLIAAVS